MDIFSVIMASEPGRSAFTVERLTYTRRQTYSELGGIHPGSSSSRQRNKGTVFTVTRTRNGRIVPDVT